MGSAAVLGAVGDVADKWRRLLLLLFFNIQPPETGPTGRRRRRRRINKSPNCATARLRRSYKSPLITSDMLNFVTKFIIFALHFGARHLSGPLGPPFGALAGGLDASWRTNRLLALLAGRPVRTRPGSLVEITGKATANIRPNRLQFRSPSLICIWPSGPDGSGGHLRMGLD